MTYPELRKQLRAQGFINHEIAALHQHYLVVTAVGVTDADIIFDRTHGLLVHQRVMPLLKRFEGARLMVDAAGDIAYVSDAKPVLQ